MKTWQFIVLAVIGLAVVAMMVYNKRNRKKCNCSSTGTGTGTSIGNTAAAGTINTGATVISE